MMRRRVLDMDEVKLKVLPSGDMRDAVRILLGQFRHRFELRWIEPAEGIS